MNQGKKTIFWSVFLILYVMKNLYLTWYWLNGDDWIQFFFQSRQYCLSCQEAFRTYNFVFARKLLFWQEFHLPVRREIYQIYFNLHYQLSNMIRHHKAFDRIVHGTYRTRKYATVSDRCHMTIRDRYNLIIINFILK